MKKINTCCVKCVLLSWYRCNIVNSHNSFQVKPSPMHGDLESHPFLSLFRNLKSTFMHARPQTTINGRHPSMLVTEKKIIAAFLETNTSWECSFGVQGCVSLHHLVVSNRKLHATATLKVPNLATMVVPQAGEEPLQDLHHVIYRSNEAQFPPVRNKEADWTKWGWECLEVASRCIPLLTALCLHPHLPWRPKICTYNTRVYVRRVHISVSIACKHISNYSIFWKQH